MQSRASLRFFVLLLLVVSAPTLRGEGRTPASDDELGYWLRNMLMDHDYTIEEASDALGLTPEQIKDDLKRLSIDPSAKGKEEATRAKKVLPYPGGRHPRIGFLDGAIDPQRETKFSTFLPWDPSQYVVVDLPEAIWVEQGTGRELLYLAHTHVPTMWDKQGIKLEPLEWKRAANGSLSIERKLPNGVVFGARVVPTREAVRMEIWLNNGTKETLRGLKVQNCVMLKGAKEFNQQANDNKLFQSPYVACHNESSDRWIITAWDRCARAWGNPPCPCLHSDPQFPDTPPGETSRLFGWLSFYEGTDIEAELKRIDQLPWRKGLE